MPHKTGGGGGGSDNDDGNSLTMQLRTLNAQLERHFLSRDDEKVSRDQQEWQLVAYVLDWLCFLVFLLAMVMSLLILFLQDRGNMGEMYYQRLYNSIIQGTYHPKQLT